MFDYKILGVSFIIIFCTIALVLLLSINKDE